MRLVATALLSTAICGQEVLWERTGMPDVSGTGGYAKFLGDVDGDGYDDLVTFALGPVPRMIGQLWILSGRDGSTLHTQPRPPGNQTLFDDYGAAGDMDGDGTPDYLFAYFENQAPQLDYVAVHSGRDGSLILRLVNPSQRPAAPQTDVLGGRDLNGDGRPDIVMRWSWDAQSAIVGAFDHTGRPLYRHVGSWSNLSYTVGSGQRGNFLGWVGDLDGDGADDYVLGSRDAALGRTVALVLSGRTGLVLRKGVNADPRAGIGWCNDGCGDMDLDGVPDFATGTGLSFGGIPQVQVFSGRTSQAILTLGSPGSPGFVLRGGGHDFDRDGVPDLVCHWGTALGEGGIYVVSGRDSTWSHRVRFCPNWYGTSRSCAYGSADFSSLEVGRPQPGNPYPVFLFPEPYYGLSPMGWPLGRIRMYRGTPPGVEPYGSACSGTLPSRPQMGLRDLQGRGVRLHLSNAPPAGYAALALGLSRTQWNGTPLPLPLDPLGLPGCSLFTSVEVLATAWTGTAGLERGYAFVDLPLPLQPPSQERFTLHGQWLVLDPIRGTAAATDALLWRH